MTSEEHEQIGKSGFTGWNKNIGQKKSVIKEINRSISLAEWSLDRLIKAEVERERLLKRTKNIVRKEYFFALLHYGKP